MQIQLLTGVIKYKNYLYKCVMRQNILIITFIKFVIDNELTKNKNIKLKF